MTQEDQRARVADHRLRRMTGRDPHEQFRVATPLELLFDLTFVVGFGVAASEFAHALAENHVGSGLLAFVNTRDAFHVLLAGLTAVVLVAAVGLAVAGLSMPVCLLVVTFAPVVTVVGFELLGHRHATDALNHALSDGT